MKREDKDNLMDTILKEVQELVKSDKKSKKDIKAIKVLADVYERLGKDISRSQKIDVMKEFITYLKSEKVYTKELNDLVSGYVNGLFVNG